MSEFRLRTRVTVTPTPESNTIPQEHLAGVANALGCTVMITMGVRIEMFEGPVAEDDTVDIDHTFKEIDDAGYNDQIRFDATGNPELAKMLNLQGVSPEGPTKGDRMVSSHAILWVFATHVEEIEPLSGEDPARLEAATADLPKRVWLVGTKVVSLRELVEGLVATGAFDVKCEHNFCASSATCSFSAIDAASAEEMRRGLDSLVATNMLRGSPLKDIETSKQTAKLQQALMYAYCVDEINKKNMGLADSTAGKFLSMSTFLQVFGGCVCFSDMSHIVRSRAVQFPIPMMVVFAYTAMQALGEDLAGMASDASPAPLIRFIKGILSMAVADSKQTEYYSDFCVYGVSMLHKKPVGTPQPDPKIDRQEFEAGEVWRYATLPRVEGSPERWVRIRLRQTEDQAQVCTGRDLRNRMCSDDCETSASLIMAIQKSLMVMKATFDTEMVTSAVMTAMRQNPDGWVRIAAGMPEIQDFLAGSNAQSKKRNVPDELFPPESRQAVAETIAVLAWSLQRLELRLDLAIGSAMAASVGGEKHECGHCYTILKITDGVTGEVTIHIIEGTNWTRQHSPDDEKDAEGIYTAMSLLSAGLMEITKTPNMSPADDIGKGIMDLGRGKFYQSVFVYGDSIQMQYVDHDTPHRCGAFIFGVPATLFVGRIRPPGRAIKVDYKILQSHLQGDGCTRTSEDLMRMVHDIGHEEAIPSWTREKWDTLMNKYSPCTCINHTTEQGFDKERHVRVVFTHQVAGVSSDSNIADFTEQVQRVLLEGEPPQITAKHRDRIARPYQADEIGGLEGLQPPTPPVLDVDVTNMHVKGLKGKVVLERTITSMSELITVCRVDKADLKSVSDMVLAWVKEIEKCQAQRVSRAAMHNMMAPHPPGGQ